MARERNLLQGRHVTLKVVTRIEHAARHLVMKIIFAKQCFNPTTNNKAMAKKQMQDRQCFFIINELSKNNHSIQQL